MSEVEFSISGVEEIVAKLRALPEDIEKRTGKAAMQRAVKLVEEEAKIAVPVKSGLLSSSITTTIQVKKGLLLGNVKAKAPHAHLIEYGFTWRPNKRQKSGTPFHVEARPKGGFMRNAIYRNADRVRQEFVEAVKESIEKLGRT